MLLRQGKLLAAVSNLHDALGFVLKAQLMKHELQSFAESLDKAAYILANDRELKKIYPLQISYKPGEERELLSSLHSLLTFLQENLADEAGSQIAALAEYRRKQLELARQLLGEREYEKAQQVCDRVIESAKNDSELILTVADLFLEFSRYDEALEYLKAAFAHNPDSAPIFNKLGMVLRKSGRFEEAEKFYIQALERQAKNEIIYFNLGRVYLDMRRWKDAIGAADRALTINPEFAEAKKMKLFAARQLEG